jgi:ribosomal protein S18 acetylase RimI-like enzyme
MPHGHARIRLMTPGDLPAALRLSRQAGWNQLEADWLRFLAMQPDGCFVAERADNCIGTVVACIFDNVAWIAMLLVDSGHRGQGIGRALFEHALVFIDKRGVATIRLDATALGQPLYEKLGFVPQYELVRYAGVPDASIASKIPLPVREAWPGDVDELMMLDRMVTQTNRRKFLERLIIERPHSLWVAEQQGQIGGYITMRGGRCALHIGPCVASVETGPALIAHAIGRSKNESIFLDVPIPNSAAVEFAESLELRVARRFVRMCRGRQIQEDVRRVWVSSGPELG